MPTQTNQDADLYIGKDYEIRFDETDGEDLSAFTDVTYVLADSEYSSTNIVEKSVSGGGITIENGSTAVVTLDASDTEALDPGNYYHELETEDGFGIEQVAATGDVVLLPSRTN